MSMLKEALYILDTSLSELENNIDEMVNQYHLLLEKSEKDNEFRKKAHHYKEKTLEELKALQQILRNELEIDLSKNIHREKEKDPSSLTILMSENE
jgi:hypothetical protein